MLGWLVSGPPLMVSRPLTRFGPVSHEVPIVAHSGARRVGSKTAVWAPPPPLGFTVRLIVVVRVAEPEVPVTVTVAGPVVAVPLAVKVSVELALPPAGGVTGLLEKDAVTPLGKPAAPSVTAELKPLMLVAETVLAPLAPWVMLTEPGLADSE